MNLLLPKLKRQQELSNNELSDRQTKIINILKGDKLNDQTLNSHKSRKHFSSDLRDKVNGSKDLINIASKQYISQTFVTAGTPQKSKRGNNESQYLSNAYNSQVDMKSQISLGDKRHSHNPSVPNLDFLQRQAEKLNNGASFDNQSTTVS